MRIQIGPQMLRLLGVAILGLMLSLAASEQANLERPHGKWNVLELVVDHDRIFILGTERSLSLERMQTPQRANFSFSVKGHRNIFAG
jgi:hypothetical protein